MVGSNEQREMQRLVLRHVSGPHRLEISLDPTVLVQGRGDHRSQQGDRPRDRPAAGAPWRHRGAHGEGREERRRRGGVAPREPPNPQRRVSPARCSRRIERRSVGRVRPNPVREARHLGRSEAPTTRHLSA